MSKYRTPHNLMRSVLDDTEYKNFCDEWDNADQQFIYAWRKICFETTDHRKTLMYSFDFNLSKKGKCYWDNIFERPFNVNRIKS